MGKESTDAKRWGHMERTLHRGEVPRTRFLDMEDAKRITVLTWPGQTDPEHQPLHGPTIGDAAFAAAFAKTCHAPEPVDIAPHETLASVLEAAAGGSLLWQNAETFYYGLRLEGCSRILTHQFIRARIGISLSETCTGDHDWRHGDFLIPRAWMRGPGLLEVRIAHMLKSKDIYAKDLDGGLESDFIFDPGFASPNDARYGLHPNLKVFLHAKVNLAMLKEWYAKRSCTMTQAYEMVVLAERVKEAVLAVTPWAKAAFTRPCDSGKCWYLGAYKQPLAMANYYRPDEVHAKFMEDWHPEEFLFPDRTHEQVSSGPAAFETREYRGYERVK